MASSSTASRSPREVGEDYFNDLSQQTGKRTDGNANDERRGWQETESAASKAKRIACVLCRKRKLRCDGQKPSCGTCTRLQHDCSYDEVRRKSGPKRGYVKALEARLAQVETLLKTQDDVPSEKQSADAAAQMRGMDKMVPEFADVATGSSNVDNMAHIQLARDRYDGPTQEAFPNTMLGAGSMDAGVPTEEPFPWEMIGLGLDEPLPNQDVVNDLNQVFFDKAHPSVPMIHRPRFLTAMNLGPHMRPPVCLRYAMWAMAASVSDKYESLQEHFYQRARKYIQQDEMKGHGESMITIAHCQTWVLLATYEFKLMYFPRAWMSAGRACRMTQMMGLHRLDGTGLDVKQCLPPPKDWTEREERRRTFWMSFCVDRYASIGTGWPMTIEEGDILTILPSEESDYEMSRPARSMSLSEALDPEGAPGLSSFGGVIIMGALFGRNLTHLHRPGPDDKDDDLNGEFWKRHRAMDNILLNTSLALPDHLRLPSGLNDPNIVFVNMNIHTSTICLHQAAIFKADKNRMASKISAESKVRCITAAAEIASIMRMISHLDMSLMNPFISFCLYVAARVFVQYLKSRPKDQQVKASLQFLLSAMHALKRKNPLTESFLVQLDVDLESAGLESSRILRARAPVKVASANTTRSPGCPTDYLGFTSDDHDPPIYGDQGLAVYNRPDPDHVPVVPPGTNVATTFNFSAQQQPELPTATAFNYVPSLDSTFNLPNRQRTPGSTISGPPYRSPQEVSGDMDTSPDGSHDQQTPNSSTQSQHNNSSHTSDHSYSSQNMQLPQSGTTPGRMGGGIFGHADTNYGTDFPMQATFTDPASATENGFVLPQNWGTGGTGFTLGAGSGMTPGSGMGDIMGMNDTDWNKLLEGFDDWESGVSQGGPLDMTGQRM